MTILAAVFVASLVAWGQISDEQDLNATQLLKISHATKCYQLRANKQVHILEQNQEDTPSRAVPQMPSEISIDPIKRMNFQAVNGFQDVDGDGAEHFRFTLVCRCYTDPNTSDHAAKKAPIAEVDCDGYLKGGHIPYSLGVDKIGQCFVASQRQTRASTGHLTRYFLQVAPHVSIDRSRVTLDPQQAYFSAGDFRLHRYTYEDVCNSDLEFSQPSAGGVIMKITRGRHPRTAPIRDEGPQYAKVAYEADLVAKTIPIA
eukprot:Gregarina_sp_Poly_1__8258@NODE_481_length_8028_cov_336_122975_g389_i0_p4_GENE_NODE_481_length_8028_cov_336_122975_g389_i0NODE_481_length_8028_cov_336_122975_g389_i0_p4_ORF_typecomplete_len258_score34_37Med26_C/PF15693_5/0_067_NODE_481_length_8028_cov_336_122975_g389_i040644837